MIQNDQVGEINMAFMAETMKRVMKACLLLAVTMILLFAFHLMENPWE